RLEDQADDEAVVVVDRDAPAAGDRRGASVALQVSALATAGADAGHQEVMLAVVVGAGLAGAIRLVDQTPFRLLEAHLWLDFKVVPDVGVQEADVEWVDAVLGALEPVAVGDAGDLDVALTLGRDEVEVGQQRRWLWAQVGED